MRLTRDRLQEWIALVAADKTEEQRERLLSRRLSESERGEFDVAEVHVTEDETGALAASVRLSPLAPGLGWLGGPWIRGGYGSVTTACAALVAEAVERAKERGLTRIEARPVLDRTPPEYIGALLGTGFRSEGERVEFKANLDDLPGEEGSPLAWKAMPEVGQALAVEMLRRASEPGSDEAKDPARAIEEWLSSLELRNDIECVHVGFLDQKPVAFVCAQVNPKDGWSRITHMGLVPEARGRGLGRWVHRHGFAILRAQGGRLYHGGTAVGNAAMIRLFESHGCRLHARMACFSWAQSRSDP